MLCINDSSEHKINIKAKFSLITLLRHAPCLIVHNLSVHVKEKKIFIIFCLNVINYSEFLTDSHDSVDITLLEEKVLFRTLKGSVRRFICRTLKGSVRPSYVEP